MTDDLQQTVARSRRLRELASRPSPDEIAAEIVGALEIGTGLGLDLELRHLAGQVSRQAKLPRETGRDDRFLFHLELALRDLALRPVEPRSPLKTGDIP
ncbi:MAG: hypothetical protein DI527_16330 [Chelatococcus sp.]|nr:MAG: hypothetical protein DI527_16330 [Chelatococcus sp.]